MSIENDSIFNDWWGQFEGYIRSDLQYAKDLAGYGNKLKDTIFRIARTDNICFYLWQKYGTEFFKLMEFKLAEGEEND